MIFAEGLVWLFVGDGELLTRDVLVVLGETVEIPSTA
jgi:hypothetical protein